MYLSKNIVLSLTSMLFIFLSMSNNSLAQEYSKVNIELYKALHSGSSQQKRIVLVKGNLGAIKNYAEANSGIQYRYGIKDIASIETDFSGISQLNRQKFIERIEYNPTYGRLLNQKNSFSIFLR